MKKFLVISFILLGLSLQGNSAPQTELRREIDAKRLGVYYTSENAMPRAREFKRLDSTYYVGWMFEGTFRYERAADYRGFKLAAEQLQQAMDLLYKDFKSEITTRTSDLELFFNQYQLRQDYDYIAYQLMNAYSNMERPDLVWKHLQFCKKINHQQETYMDTYSYLAWTVHRNRFYTTDRYSFLKKSIAENEKYAHRLLDSAELKLKQDAALNNKMFMGDYYKTGISSVWHYRSILYSYSLDIKNAGDTYKKLKKTYAFPENNYATFCAIQGKFREAAYYYNQAKEQDQGDKRLNESFYYSTILNVYRNQPKIGVQEIKDIISANGTTPGFGWYNLALSRALIYDGQLAAAKKRSETAEQFKEIHRGTTLGQSHYDFTNALLQLVIKEKEIRQIKFMDRGWWYSFSNLAKLAQLSAEKYGLQFLIINQLAANPERELVIYKLFSTENTVSYDEIWYLIKDFSTNFFLKKYTEYALKDDRPLLKKYYEYFLAKLFMEKGEYKFAREVITKILTEAEIDAEYENLYLARVFLAYAECQQELGQKNSAKQYLCKAYETYPQLIPFTNQKINIKLHASASTGTQAELIDNLRDKNINWVNEGKNNKTIDVFLKFGSIENYPTVSFETNYNGKVIVSKKTFSYENAQTAADELALYIFNIGNEDKSFNMNEPKGNLYSLSGSQALNNDFKNLFSSSVITSSAFTKSMAN